MATLYTKCGTAFQVDDEDAKICRMLSWKIYKNKKQTSAHRYVVSPNGERLSRLLLGAPEGVLVDHIDGNTLDNRRSNLRLATVGQNQHNAARRLDNTSGYKGVSYDKDSGLWEAHFKLNGKKRKVGRFRTPELAHTAVCAARVEAHGVYARHG